MTACFGETLGSCDVMSASLHSLVHLNQSKTPCLAAAPLDRAGRSELARPSFVAARRRVEETRGLQPEPVRL